MWTLIIPFLIYWMVLFVACFVVVEIGQDQLYDEVTPHSGLKVGSGSLLIALLLIVLRKYGITASYDTMFTSNFAWTVLQGLVWFGVFTLILQFHPWHALGLGLATMVLVTGLATMGVDSLTSPRPVTPRTRRSAIMNKPVRHSATPVAPAQKSETATPKQ